MCRPPPAPTQGILIPDGFAMRELSLPQADDLYELVTERAGRSIVFTSNRTPADWYPLFPNPVVAESIRECLFLVAMFLSSLPAHFVDVRLSLDLNQPAGVMPLKVAAIWRLDPEELQTLAT